MTGGISPILIFVYAVTAKGSIHFYQADDVQKNSPGNLQPFDMDPGSVIPVPDQVRDDGSGTGVTGC
jgi:hypothetical protein